MLDSATYVGGLPIGAIVSGQFGGRAQFVPCDGREYLKSAYPNMADFTDMTAFGSNAITGRTLPATQSWSAVAFGNGVFVAVNKDASTAAASSVDGITWTARTIPTGAYYSVIYAAGLFVAVGNAVCATSPDGITWTARTMAGAMSSLAYGNGLFVAMSGYPFAGSNDATYYTSPDGITWTARTMPAAYAYSAISFAGDRFVASAYLLSGGGTTNGYESLDGINWNAWTPPIASPESMVEFKGRLYIQGGSNALVFDPGAQSLYNGSALLRPGWMPAYAEHTATAFQFAKAGEWLFAIPTTGSNLIAATLDGVAWRPLFRLTTSSTSLNPLTKIAYGNNALVILANSTSSNASLYSLSADTTRFRVPKVRTYSEVDRPYMKVA